MYNKKISCFIFVCLQLSILIGCGAPKISEDQDFLKMKYYSASISGKCNIEVGGEKIGKYKESGLLNIKYQFNFTDSGYYEYEFSDYENLGVDNDLTASNYQIKDEDENIFGYVQETIIEFENERNYEYLFYDKDKNLQDFYYDHDTKKFYDWDGNVLVNCSYHSSWEITFLKGTAWNVYMVFDKEDCPVPYEYMVFAYLRIKSDISTYHN